MKKWHPIPKLYFSWTETQAAATTAAQSTETCADKISDCADYGADVCTAYGEWAKTNCQKHCDFCLSKKGWCKI